MRLTTLLAITIGTSACFATRSDVRILQDDILALRADQARADSARARQLEQIAQGLSSSVVSVRDSVLDLGNRLTTFQGSTRQELYSIGQQLLQLGELMGQSQAAMSRFQAEIEERNRQAMQEAIRAATPVPQQPGAQAATPPTTPPGAPDTAQSIVPPAPTEGPNVLYQIGRDQSMAGAYSSARDAFGQVLELHPQSDRAPDAQLGIAEAFQAENRIADADSTYRVVFSKYPTSEAAPPAMYKLGLSLDRQGKRAEARAMMQRLVREYPRSDSYALATDWLNRNP